LWIEPRPGMGTIAGRVLDATGQTVPGVRVYGLIQQYPVETPFSFVETYGDRGNPDPSYNENFAVTDIPPGTYMLMTDHLVYGSKMDTLDVPSGQRLTVDMRMDSRPIAIAPITVTVDAREPISVRMSSGYVVTAEQIEKVRQRARDASDILRSLNVPGVIVRHRSNGTICVGYVSGQVAMNQTGCVEMLIYLNDVRTTNPDHALRLPPEAIERMVIYKPVDAGNLFGLGGGNGVWMIYTRGN